MRLFYLEIVNFKKMYFRSFRFYVISVHFYIAIIQFNSLKNLIVYVSSNCIDKKNLVINLVRKSSIQKDESYIL